MATRIAVKARCGVLVPLRGLKVNTGKSNSVVSERAREQTIYSASPYIVREDSSREWGWGK